MPRPARKRKAVATDENSLVEQKLAENVVANTEIRTPLSTITNFENQTISRRSSSRQRKTVVYTEVAEDHVSDEQSDDKSNTSSSTDQIEKDLMLLPEARKRNRQDGESDSEEPEESESEEESDRVTHRSRESDKERAEKLKMFEEEQAAKFAAIDDFELNFEEVAEDSFDKSMSEQSEASGDSQDPEIELADVLGGRDED
ncbi:hypothetical protein B0I72DRAFT_140643 [Yarrowia lipolytica]|uniref:Uncharacterized protein n=1 Tax=Yarrowia lipolytica TaxID=4952 RepID=A0A371C1I7_YARLL|nr:hypothetical protein B0I71DRAFT_134691 [Yarrowia lipolytica]RDW30968.1 hypothetical protein B0I72DRAFT_140643 [Yarrowia lipolytica]RDW37807.1 hypothetical protein B0I73DRAFT_134903 [Yarrowia lipolytica]RDW47131.1 hypothetical protein B0I74DRAFT_135789 [Yarrowia lipolytica]RDW53358.1 hypothetical protein B0I75DRAFT_136455 [Yarrowia lipolytica]